ncbi:MAG: Flp pilus assembly complex ATPase component TadA [Clostridia bacterium]|nr:Flp pilus assembly complex ATPase component TadA [Clostridia bacterium]
MVNIESILDRGVSSAASDIHLIHKNRPILRVKKELIYLNEYDVLEAEDMQTLYNYFVGDNEEKRQAFNKNKLLDVNFELNGKRFRVNVSLSNDIPIFTIRIIQDILPKFEQLGLPDIVKRMVFQTQGLILVTGKPNSGKTTTLNALVDEINEVENKKILMLENPIEFVHKNKRSLIIQKEVGIGRDCNDFSDGTKNALREDCDILIIGEIRDKETMDAAIEMAESGHLVIGTLHTKSCAETLDRITNFYDLSDQLAVKFMMSALLKLVVAQRLLKRTNGSLLMVPEVMVVDSTMAGVIRKDKFTKSEIEDAIQTGIDKGNVSFNISLANAVVDGLVSLENAMKEIDEKSHEMFLRTVNQIKTKKLL